MPNPKKLEISSIHEEKLWKKKFLNLDSSTGLSQAVVFYLIKCFGLWQGKDLRQLKTHHVKFGEDDLGKFVSVDIKSILNIGRVVRRYDDPSNPRSVYKILKTYERYLANEGPFLVRPITSIKDYLCYSPWPLGVSVIDQTVHTILQESGEGSEFGNVSVSLLAIDILKNFGAGSHCLSTWMLRLYPIYTKSYWAGGFKECTTANCEEKNPEMCLMISRLLDPPYPTDASVMMDEVGLHGKEVVRSSADVKNSCTTSRPSFESWITNINKQQEDDGDIVYQKTESIDCEKNSLNVSNEKNEVKKSKVENRTKKCCLKPAEVKVSVPSLSRLQTSKSTISNVKVKTEVVNLEKLESSYTSDLKIMTVLSIPESAFSMQVDEDENVQTKSQSLISQNSDHDNALGDTQTDDISDHDKTSCGTGCKRKEKDSSAADVCVTQHTGPKLRKLDLQNGHADNDSKRKVEMKEFEEEMNEGDTKIELNGKIADFDEEDNDEGDENFEAVYDDSTLLSRGDDKDEKNDKKSGEERIQEANQVQVFSNKPVELKGDISERKKELNEIREEHVRGGNLADAQHNKHEGVSLATQAKDSIQILRNLLQRGTTERPENLSNNCLGKYERDKTSEIVSGPISLDSEVKKLFPSVSKTVDSSEDCSIDLSPPVLSPQTVSFSSENLVDSENLIPSEKPASLSHGQDMIKFLDTAQAQMKSLLQASGVEGNVSGKINTISRKKEGKDPNSNAEVSVVSCQDSNKDILPKTNLINYQLSQPSVRPDGNDNNMTTVASVGLYQTSPRQENFMPEKFQHEKSPNHSLQNSEHPSKPSKNLPLSTEDKSQKNFSCPLLRSVLEASQDQLSPSKLLGLEKSVIRSSLSEKENILTMKTDAHVRAKTQAEQNKTESEFASSSQIGKTVDNVCIRSTNTDNMKSSSEKFNKSGSSTPDQYFDDAKLPKDTSPTPSEKNQASSAVDSSSLPHSVPLSSSFSASSPPLLSSCQSTTSELSTNSGIYRYQSNYQENIAQQVVQVNSLKDGCRTFSMADLPLDVPNTANKEKVIGLPTSEINLGDYFPPNTLIPARSLKLLTKQSVNGLEIVLKFDFSKDNQNPAKDP